MTCLLFLQENGELVAIKKFKDSEGESSVTSPVQVQFCTTYILITLHGVDA